MKQELVGDLVELGTKALRGASEELSQTSSGVGARLEARDQLGDLIESVVVTSLRWKGGRTNRRLNPWMGQQTLPLDCGSALAVAGA